MEGLAAEEKLTGTAICFVVIQQGGLWAMPLTVRLDPETERCLADLLAESGQDRTSLIRQLIRGCWQQRLSSPAITARLGGHPASFLST